jgi:hypothetical protein
LPYLAGRHYTFEEMVRVVGAPNRFHEAPSISRRKAASPRAANV